MHQKLRPPLLAACCALLLCAVLITTGTYAWLSKKETADKIYTGLSDFEVEGILTLGGNSNVTADGESLLIPIDLGDPTADNYIGSFKYVVRYSGVSPALIRVRIVEQWLDTTTGEILSSAYLPYHTSQELKLVEQTGTTANATYPAAGSAAAGDILSEAGIWVDNRRADYCYYYSVPVQPRELPVTENGETLTTLHDATVELTLIDETDKSAEELSQMLSGINTASTELSLMIEVQAVQPNRYREFFGIDTLPAGVMS